MDPHQDYIQIRHFRSAPHSLPLPVEQHRGALAGFILVVVVPYSVEVQRFSVTFQRLSRFKGKDVFNMDSTEGH